MRYQTALRPDAMFRLYRETVFSCLPLTIGWLGAAGLQWFNGRLANKLTEQGQDKDRLVEEDFHPREIPPAHCPGVAMPGLHEA